MSTRHRGEDGFGKRGEVQQHVAGVVMSSRLRRGCCRDTIGQREARKKNWRIVGLTDLTCLSAGTAFLAPADRAKIGYVRLPSLNPLLSY